MRLEAVMAAIMNITVFWNVTLCTPKTAAVGFLEMFPDVLSGHTASHLRRRVNPVSHETWVKTNQENALQELEVNRLLSAFHLVPIRSRGTDWN
jgi:hypothetical protein